MIHNLVTRFRMGWPVKGEVTRHLREQYDPVQAGRLTNLLSERFGDLSRKICMDLGCGSCSSFFGAQVLEIPWRRLISVECFFPYIHKLREKTVAAERHDICEIPIQNIFNDFVVREAHVALMIDVIEHLPGREVRDMLVKLEEFVANGVLIIFAIRDEIPKASDEENAFLHIRSLWKPEDLAELGYRVDVYENFPLAEGRPPVRLGIAAKTWER